jgi:hypothetical protein
MNAIKAKKACLSMWTWLRDNDALRDLEKGASLIKELYFKSQLRKNPRWYNNCALCAAFKIKQTEDTYEDCCTLCPLDINQGAVGCDEPGEPYFMWRTAKTHKQSIKAASALIAQVKAWNPREEQSQK